MKHSRSTQTQEKLDRLLHQYKAYNEASTEHEKDRIGDEMTYADPIVWMMYKHKAYLGSDHEITTVGMLREHCSDHGGICAKRFDFIASSIKNSHNADIRNTHEFPDAMNIVDLYESDILESLVADDAFMASWRTYEFFKKDGKVAKWQNYPYSCQHE